MPGRLEGKRIGSAEVLQPPSGPGPRSVAHLFSAINFRSFWFQNPSASENTKRTYTWPFRPRTEMTNYVSSQPHQESPAEYGHATKIYSLPRISINFSYIHYPVLFPILVFRQLWKQRDYDQSLKGKNFLSMPIHTPVILMLQKNARASE